MGSVRVGPRRGLIVTYLDSSALLRLVMGQGDVSIVETALAANPTSSSLTSLEIEAAIYKKWHDRQMTEVERDVLLAVAEQRILETLVLLELDAETLSEAHGVTKAHPLRTLDAIHVAAAIRAGRYARRHSARLDFVSADRRQAEAARQIFGNDAVIFVPSPN